MAKPKKPHLSKEQKEQAQQNAKTVRRGKRTEEAAQTTEQYAYRFEGHPDDDTANLFCRTIGCARFIWNKMKADKDAAYAKDKTIIYPTPAQYKGEFPWLKEVDSFALCNVQLNLDSAYRAFYNGKAEFPNFKKKNKCRDSYTTNVVSYTDKDNNPRANIRLEGNLLYLPKAPAPVRLNVHRDIRPGGKLKHVTVTHEPNGKWMFSLVYEYPKTDYTVKSLENGFTHIGLDMSLPQLYVDSEGRTPGMVKPFRAHEAKLAKEQRKLNRMKKDSKNRERQRKKIAKVQSKIKNARKDFLHKESHKLVTSYDVIGIEDLNMAAMKQSLNLGKSASDIGWGEFTTMLEYKAKQTGCRIVKIDRWYPSSKTCSCCGNVNHDLKLDDRTFICPACGFTVDRDYQAACNIDREAVRLITNAAPAC